MRQNKSDLKIYIKVRWPQKRLINQVSEWQVKIVEDPIILYNKDENVHIYAVRGEKRERGIENREDSVVK